MRIAVLSDIHSNLEALEAVTADLKQRFVDRVICLGDNVGYGPDPQEVVELIRLEGFFSVLGNHEFAFGDQRGRRWLNFQAAENNEATEELLSSENRDYCCALPACLELEGAHFVHGYPRDNVFRYLNKQSDERIASLFAYSSSSLFFLGHTHNLQVITMEEDKVRRARLAEGIVKLAVGRKYIFNCGSVGQPRDGDNRAKYLIWDTCESEVEVRCVAYDFQATMAKIRKLGFPEVYALRLR